MEGSRVSRLRVFTPIAAVCLMIVGGCGAARPSTTPRSAPAGATSRAAPPHTVIAYPLRPDAAGGLRSGSRVGAGFTGIRAFINRRDGFAIADLPQASDGTYPLATTDGGKTWRTDGPVLHVPAAQGAAAVEQAGVAASRIYFAWCPACNNLIDITPDAGRHWWAVRLPGQILTLVGTPYARAGLLAVVEGPTSDPRGRGSSLWVFGSTNGRRWTYRYTMNAVS